MDKNLNSSVRAPWWITLLQLAPIVLQLANEIAFRIQGGTSFDGSFDLEKVEISVPVIVTPDKFVEP